MPTLTLLSSVLLLSAFAIGTPAAEQTALSKPSLVEARIAEAQAKVKATPNVAAAYNDLAFALCRKGRDTEDLAVFTQAQLAVDRSLKLTPANYEARKLLVTVLLGKHEFAQALQLATELNHKVPDDLAVWASLVDINIALGNYSEAEPQAQWVLDLRPGNALGFEKSAALRELFGDVPGAVEFFDEANRRTSPNDADQHAWLLTQKARLQLVSGYDREAETLLQQQVATLLPDSQFATGVLAQICMAEGKYQEAASLFAARYARVKNARNLYDWAAALDKSGDPRAAATFNHFEEAAAAETTKPFNANRELVLFYLDHKRDTSSAAKALSLATSMTAERHDSGTLDAYAWALYSNGKHAEAKAQMDRALAVGVRDPLYFCHAAQIASKAGDTAAATNYQKELVTFKGSSCPAAQAGLVTRVVTKAVTRAVATPASGAETVR